MEAIKFKSDDINTVYELRKAAGVEAGLDIYEGLYHAFDLIEPETEVSRLAAIRFEAAFAYAMEHYSGE